MEPYEMQGETVCGDTCITMDDATLGNYRGLDIKAKDVKEVVGEALSEVDGILALKGGLTDVFKKDEDLTRGISVSIDQADSTVKVSAKVISDSLYSNTAIVTEATELVASALLHETGLDVRKIEIDVADSMSLEEFLDRYGEDRVIN